MITVDQELCIQCGLCVKDCVDSLMRMKKGKVIGPETCLECGHCVAVCPKGAVSMEGYDMTECEDIVPGEHLDPQSLLKAIKSRRSIRQYQDRKISPEDLHMILEAGRYTATAKNGQQTTFVVVQDQLQELKEMVWKFVDEMLPENPADLDAVWGAYYLFAMRRKKDPANDYLFRNAPAVMVLATDYPWDAGLEAQNMEMMAASLEMGVLYNGYLMRLINQSEEIRSWLGLGEKRAAAVMLMGYPAVKYQRTVVRRTPEILLK